MANGNLPAVPAPFLQAAGQAALAGHEAQLKGFIAQAEAMLANVCAQGAQNAAALGRANIPPNQGIPGYPAPKPDCGCGGKCPPGGQCKGGLCPPNGGGGGTVGDPYWPQFPPNGDCRIPPPAGIRTFPGTVPMLFNGPPGCYDCSCLDPCLYDQLMDARWRFDTWQWNQAWQKESEIVHLNVNAGAAPFNVPPIPIAANTSSLFAQQADQILPYIPGVIKVNVKFSSDVDALDAVSLQFYTGPRPTLTGQTDTSQLIEAGRAFLLSDFVCGDSCYVQPFMRLYGCIPGPIPDTRALYLKVTAGAIPGNATITSFSAVVIKQGSWQYANCCKKFDLPMVGKSSGQLFEQKCGC